jgi:hypothetical protein
MKKLKISLLALLFTVGIGGAVVQKIHAAPKPQGQVYSWTSNLGGGPFTGTIAQAQSNYGCSKTTTLCATGTAPGVPNAQIFQH